MLTATEFSRLSPYQRGRAVYLLGCRADQPHVPDEKNPYPAGTLAHTDWGMGYNEAALVAQECDD